MGTPLSGATPYCTAQQFVDRFDWRTAADLLSDSGTRLTLQQVLASTVLLELLQEASGLVESACMVGNRYAPADLAGLTGNSQQLLIGLTAGVAAFHLFSRRPDRKLDVPPRAQWAMEMLAKLEEGTAVFGILEVAEAGVVDHLVEQPSDVEARNMVTRIAGRFFGRRSNDMRPPAGTGGG